MKTEQERIEQMDKMAQVMCGFCTEDKRCVLRYSAPCSEVKSQDCSYKGNAEMLICAGYGDVSEYKAEIEQLKENLKNLKDDFESLQKDYEFVRDCDAEHCLEIEETVKQAKIDVLNELRKDCGSVGVIMLTDRDIDEMIEEIENNGKKRNLCCNID